MNSGRIEERARADRTGRVPSERSRPRRAQWGAEKFRRPLPAVPPAASHAATWVGGFGIAFAACAYVAYVANTIVGHFIDGGLRGSAYLAQSIAYLLVMTFLTFSSVMYLLARQGALHRSRTHHQTPRAELEAHFNASSHPLTVLVPAYREDPDVVRLTLLSAALQEYPELRVVLLIDDPPNPDDAAHRAGLDSCRDLPAQLAALLAEPLDHAERARERVGEGTGAARVEQVLAVEEAFDWSASWLVHQGGTVDLESHTERFFAEEILTTLAGDLTATAGALRAARGEGVVLSRARLVQLAERLVWTFGAEFASFERKQYANLCHEANKAMNLNSYIALMGGAYRQVSTRDGVMLRRADPGEARSAGTSGEDVVEIPDSTYVLTLDADSVLLREYCLRLVYQLELPGNERIAVIQTPYSAFRGAPTRLERIAGATTDVQHVLHQGLTHYGATFWVGANAVIRKAALEDIAETSWVDGHEERRYIQDRTVIEDTESSVDLLRHGWTLHNYGERLSYSATPPDFGALTIQRARWANGGLLIIPGFLRYLRARRKDGSRVRLAHATLRMNYMGSICWASVGLVVLLVFPFDSRLLSPLILLAALPYFLAMSSDLHRLGYKRTDVLRIYGFNLILLPVNLVGTLKSVQQAAANSKIPFARTPKVRDRTATPALYVLAAAAIAAYSFYTLAHDVVIENWPNAAFATFNGVLTLYAIAAFMGVGNSLVDLFSGAARWVHVPVGAGPATGPGTDDTGGRDWEDILYYGPDAGGAPARAVVRALAPRRGETRARWRGMPDIPRPASEPGRGVQSSAELASEPGSGSGSQAGSGSGSGSGSCSGAGSGSEVAVAGEAA